MFVRLGPRLTCRLRDGLDLAVELATLGEYRLADPARDGVPDAAPRSRSVPAVDRAGTEGGGWPDRCPGSGRGHGSRVGREARRRREGAAPSPQPCLGAGN